MGPETAILMPPPLDGTTCQVIKKPVCAQSDQLMPAKEDSDIESRFAILTHASFRFSRARPNPAVPPSLKRMENSRSARVATPGIYPRIHHHTLLRFLVSFSTCLSRAVISKMTAKRDSMAVSLFLPVEGDKRLDSYGFCSF